MISRLKLIRFCISFSGGCLIGCGAGFMNVPKIKGTHTAQKSGMLAAEAIFDAIQAGDSETEGIYPQAYEEKLKNSSIWKELHAVRNVKPAFARYGLYGGMAYTGTFLRFLKHFAYYVFFYFFISCA